MRVLEPVDSHGLGAILAETALAGRDVVELPIFDAVDVALGIGCSAAEMMTMWTAARSVLRRTGRWPVVVADYMGYYENGVFAGHQVVGSGAREILTRAAQWTPAAASAAWWRRVEWDRMPARDYVEYHLNETRCHRGANPTEAKTLAAIGPDATVTQLERYLLEWEMSRFGSGAPPSGWGASPWMEWRDDDRLAVIFLPEVRSSVVPAYISYYGAEWADMHSELVAILRGWHDDFGAELVAHWGTTLQFTASRPPTDIEQAWTLAGQQMTAGMMSDHTRRHLALKLMTRDRWFLHQHP